jgi:hypothetical protein
MRAVLNRIGLYAVFALGSALGLLAQQPGIVHESDDNIAAPIDETTAADVGAEALVEPLSAAPAQPLYTPLSLKQKYVYSINEIFGIAPLLGAVAHAALDQAGVQPAQWGKTPDSFAIRAASRFGDRLMRHSLEFGVRALDHEDPRYFRSGEGSGFRRAGYAVVHTFLVRRDTGGNMPAYSLFVTDYTMPFVVRQWHPDRYHTLDAVEAGTLAVGIGIASNLFNEFWPDLKKKLPGRLSREPLLGRLLNAQDH